MTSERGSERKVVWILGLMHSGTTIFWRAFRKDKRFLCLDEPFSGLEVLPGQNSRNSYGEFIEVLNRDPRMFWNKYAPLHPLQELDGEFTQQQQDYLAYLLEQANNLVIDETHLHFHLPILAKLTPDAYVIHLYRRASGFCTSHLRPSRPKNKRWLRNTIRRLRHEYDKKVFWTREDFPTGLRRDDVIGNHALSKFGMMLSDAGYNLKQIMPGPAIGRLLAYWHLHFHYAEKEGPNIFGHRFRSLSYEDFASNPEETMASIYNWIEISAPQQVDYTEVHRPTSSFHPDDARWLEFAKSAGFSDYELNNLL